MKKCSHCGAANIDSAKFCNDCGTALPAPLAKTVKITPSLEAGSFAEALKTKAKTLENKRRADIMFVLDCTGSMRGEIDAIRDAITAFADSIASDGVRCRVGLIEFRDRLIKEEHRALIFDGEPFTSNPAVFRREVAKLTATGGGDDPESSLDAIMLALRQPFAAGSNKVIVLVTDAPPHIPDKDTKSMEEVLRAIDSAGVGQFYWVGRTLDAKSQVYLQLLQGRRGMAFELGNGDNFRSRAEHFKRTLMALGKTISTATL